MKRLNIAIDGPAGAGKTTLAKWIAKHYRLQFVDTGAMYRGIAFLAIRDGITPQDAVALATFSTTITFSFEMQQDLTNRVFANGEDISSAIRTPDISMAASEVSKHPRVRQVLVAQQQQLAKHKNVVMEGRDIGTVVLPDADIKFFMLAHAGIRARRRCRELEMAGARPDIRMVTQDLQKRDHQDQTRTHSPLVKAPDAIAVDTTDLGIEGVFAVMKAYIDGVLRR